jgi:hypothetical protein
MSDTISTPKVKKARKSKLTPEILEFAIELRKTEGAGLVRMSKAIVEKYPSVKKLYPSELQSALKRYANVDSVKDLARAKTTKAKAGPAPASPAAAPRKSTSRRPGTKT